MWKRRRDDREYNVSYVMCYADAGIKLYGGVSGNTDEAVQTLLAGKLAFDPDVHCDHHEYHGEEHHDCGEHGCGKSGHNCR